MAVGKRSSTGDPLTEHDVAARIDHAALRLWKLLLEFRQLGMTEQIRGSRYSTNALEGLADEMQTWGIEPRAPRPSTEPPTVRPDSSADTANQLEGGPF